MSSNDDDDNNNNEDKDNHVHKNQDPQQKNATTLNKSNVVKDSNNILLKNKKHEGRDDNDDEDFNFDFVEEDDANLVIDEYQSLVAGSKQNAKDSEQLLPNLKISLIHSGISSSSVNQTIAKKLSSDYDYDDCLDLQVGMSMTLPGTLVRVRRNSAIIGARSTNNSNGNNDSNNAPSSVSSLDRFSSRDTFVPNSRSPSDNSQSRGRGVEVPLARISPSSPDP